MQMSEKLRNHCRTRKNAKYIRLNVKSP